MPNREKCQQSIDRRTFLSESARHGTAVAGLALAPSLIAKEARAAGGEPGSMAQRASEAPEPSVPKNAELPEISVASGPDPFASTLKAIEQQGGMSRTVSANDRVALLMNTWSSKPGTYTKPQIVLAVAQLCFEAGAKRVVCLKDEDEDYWELSPESAKHAALVSRIKPADSDHREVKVNGRALKTANVLETALDFEVLINLPIIKDHSGCKMTGCLKNMMGLTSLATNVGFHLGDSPVGTFITNIGNSFPLPEHFGQCVADLYTVRRPDLCVLDATEFITTNGPSGPGKLKRPGEVIVGTDPVAIDALACAHLGLDTSEVFILTQAHESGVGEIDPSKRRIQRTKLV